MTSLKRLEDGERKNETVSRVFARAEPIERRMELANTLVAFALTQRGAGNAALKIVTDAISPHLDAAGCKPTGALAKAIKKAARKSPAEATRKHARA